MSDLTAHGLRIQADHHESVLRDSLGSLIGYLASAKVEFEREQYAAVLKELQGLLTSYGFAVSAASALAAIDKARELVTHIEQEG